MTSLESSEVQEDSLPSSLGDSNGIAVVESASSPSNGVVVRVTQHPMDKPLRMSAEALQSGKATPTDPFSEGEGMEKGLSCLSLEVMTSGEHLNALSSLDDLSFPGEEAGSGSGRGSSPEVESGRSDSPARGVSQEGRERDESCRDEREGDPTTGPAVEELRSPNDITTVVEGESPIYCCFASLKSTP